MKRQFCLFAALLLCLLLFAQACAESYPQPLYKGETIYAGPGYGFSVAQTLSEDGTFTIVDQTWDEAGNLWGKLKSGAGWVFLRSERAMVGAPISAGLADEELIAKGPYAYILVDKTLNATEIVIYAHETLHDVCFFEYVLDDSGRTENPLHSLAELTLEKPIVAAISFYGDMTAYGISFIDASGAKHCYEISLSGVDGSVVLTECPNEHL